MKMLKDSSEVKEARELLLQIMNAPASAPSAGVGSLSNRLTDAAPASVVPAVVVTPSPAVVEQWVAVPASAGGEREAPASAVQQWSRGDRLQNILALFCEREGLTGALVTDSNGLPLAASSSVASSENLAAFSTVLGDVLTKASSYLGQDDASDVSLDINASQKVVLRRFDLEGRPCYLLVLCAAVCEPRRAMREAIPGIVSTLAVS
jgi:predicted regulator of Ras-like GTPase activity (Roadblock/LC7/MglB family)